jgi:hypothetical protein
MRQLVRQQLAAFPTHRVKPPRPHEDVLPASEALRADLARQARRLLPGVQAHTLEVGPEAAFHLLAQIRWQRLPATLPRGDLPLQTTAGFELPRQRVCRRSCRALPHRLGRGLLGHAVGLAFQRVIHRADFQLGLHTQQARHRLVARHALQDHQVLRVHLLGMLEIRLNGLSNRLGLCPMLL